MAASDWNTGFDCLGSASLSIIFRSCLSHTIYMYSFLLFILLIYRMLYLYYIIPNEIALTDSLPRWALGHETYLPLAHFAPNATSPLGDLALDVDKVSTAHLLG